MATKKSSEGKQDGERENKKNKSKRRETFNESLQREKKKESDKVILMGAPQQNKEIPDFVKEEKTEVPLESSDITNSKDEEEKPIEIKNKSASKSSQSHMNLGRVFFSFAFIFIVFLAVGNALNWFGAVDINYLSLWPLLFIFVVFLLFKVKTTSGKILGALVILIVLGVALSILMRGDGIMTVVLSGEVVSEEREIEEFDNLVFEGVGEVEFIQAEETSLVVEGDENVLSQITTNSTDGVLTISYESPIWRLFLFDVARITITVSSPSYSGIHLIGSGDISGSSIEAEDLTLSISGSGSMNIDNVNVQNLTSKITGSGDIVLSGAASQQIVSISGSGDYDALNLESMKTGIRISGSGDVEVNVKELLDVSISGSGDVRYLGSPKLEEGRVSGSGSIKALVRDEPKNELDPKEFYEKVKPVF